RHDLQVRLHVRHRLQRLPRAFGRLLGGGDLTACRIHRLLRDDEVVAGDGSGRRGGALQSIVRPRLGIGPGPGGRQLRARRLHLRLRFCALRRQLRRVERREDLPRAHPRPAIHGDRLHEPGHLRIHGDRLVGLQLPGQRQRHVHRLLDDAHDLDHRRRILRRCSGRRRRLAGAARDGADGQGKSDRTCHVRYALSGSSGSSDADPRRAEPCAREYTDGSTSSVAAVAAARPPITARPSGAVAPAPSPKASAIGSMPAIIAALVISTGRRRARAAATAGSASPVRRASSANVTSRIAFATATPIAMMAPMNDCTFTVVRVASSRRTTPASTAGTVDTTTNARRTDWKFAASSRKITTTATRSPAAMFRKVSRIGAICPRTLTDAPRGTSPARTIASSTWAATRPRSSPAAFADSVTMRWPLKRSYSPTIVPL